MTNEIAVYPVRLLVLQGTPFCNLNCSYCYLPDRRDKRRMSAATLEATLGNLLASGIVQSELLVNWHAGEPMSLGPRFYNDMIPRFESLTLAGITVTHSLQTNATLVTPEFCEIFQRFQNGIDV